MAQQTRVFATFADDNAVGSAVWASPGNALASDNAYASTFFPGAGGQSHYLKATNSAYATGSNTLVIGSTINFIDYNVERSKVAGAANVRDLFLYSVEAGFIISANNYADTLTDWGTSDAVVAHTQNTNLPSAATILASNWGFVLACQNTNGNSGAQAQVDWLYATIDFTPPAAAIPNKSIIIPTFAPMRAARW